MTKQNLKSKRKRGKMVYIIVGIVVIIAIILTILLFPNKQVPMAFGERSDDFSSVKISDEQALSIAKDVAMGSIFKIIGSKTDYKAFISDKYMVDGDLVILVDNPPEMFGMTAVKMDPVTGKVKDTRSGDVAVPGF